jgi:hypothetical protein
VIYLAEAKHYNLGFLVLSIAAVLLSVDPFHGQAGALWLIVFTAAVVMSVIGAAVSLARGTRYVHPDRAPEPQASEVAAAAAR